MTCKVEHPRSQGAAIDEQRWMSIGSGKRDDPDHGRNQELELLWSYECTLAGCQHVHLDHWSQAGRGRHVVKASE
jgi:hypothetical protein